MSATHTPGPWSIDEIDFESSAHIIGASNGFCSDIVATLPMGWEESKSNARLIAAAPDLLAALRAMTPDAYSGEPPKQAALYAPARAAIAEATGAAS